MSVTSCNNVKKLGQKNACYRFLVISDPKLFVEQISQVHIQKQFKLRKDLTIIVIISGCNSGRNHCEIPTGYECISTWRLIPEKCCKLAQKSLNKKKNRPTYFFGLNDGQCLEVFKRKLRISSSIALGKYFRVFLIYLSKNKESQSRSSTLTTRRAFLVD